jgi:crotonobetainyl-CoA:carnitine CoA-transferase CaiB-like acyl-CoA transferase
VPEKFWLALLEAIDRVDLATNEKFKTRDGRRQHYEALEQELQPVFAKKTRAQWVAELEAKDVPVAPIYNIAEALDDPQIQHLGLTEELHHPEIGNLKFVRGPVSYNLLNKENSTPPPLLGEQTVAILSEMGYGRAAIDELAAQGITKIAPA